MIIKPLAIAVAMALTLQAPAFARSHGDANWEIVHIDEEGEIVRKRKAFESVAIVEGPRNLRLEVGCNRNDRRFLRLRRVIEEADSNKAPDILGDKFRPLISVLYQGRELYSARQEQWQFNEKRGSYQGRNDRELNDAIARGGRLVIEAPQQDWRAAFSLDGSMDALDEIDCR